MLLDIIFSITYNKLIINKANAVIRISSIRGNQQKVAGGMRGADETDMNTSLSTIPK